MKHNMHLISPEFKDTQNQYYAISSVTIPSHFEYKMSHHHRHRHEQAKEMKEGLELDPF